MTDRDLAADVSAFDRLMQHQRRLGRRILPTFIGIGPGRAGSSSLFRLLSAHPEVHMAPVKEINFFGFRAANPKARRPGMTRQEYATFFLGGETARAVGEISPSYFILPEAITEIRDLLPDCKLICGLRNPLERLLSHYAFHRAQHRHESFDTFVASARADFSRRNDPAWRHQWARPVRILASSLYADTVTSCLATFGAQSFFLYRFEDFVAGPTVADALLAFLGLSSLGHAPEPSNASGPLAVGETISGEHFAWLCEVLRTDLAALEDTGVLACPDYHELDAAAHRAGLRVV